MCKTTISGRNHFLKKSQLTALFGVLDQKRVDYICIPKIMIYSRVHKENTQFNMVKKNLVNKLWASAVNSKNWIFKSTTYIICIVMLFGDTNSLLTTKPYNFDIKCQCNSKSYEIRFLGPRLGVVWFSIYIERFFFWKRETDIRLKGWTLS